MNLIEVMGHKIFFKPPQNPLESTFVLKWDMGTIRRFCTQEVAFRPLAQDAFSMALSPNWASNHHTNIEH
jgi:hypothetical protein